MKFENYKVSDIKMFLSDLDMDNPELDIIIDEISGDSRATVKRLLSQFKNKYRNFNDRKLMNEKFYNFDRDYVLRYNYIIAGCDEVGRGPLAGPIVCACVILDLYSNDKIIKDINDSKKIKDRNFRKYLSDVIKEKAKHFNIVEISNTEIDRIGIGVANQIGLRRSVEGVNSSIDLVLSDGYPIEDLKFKNIHLIKGDTKSASIMCASIIAKVYRDEILISYHEEFPQYDFINNVGYGTRTHVQAIMKYGACKYHRRSFLKNYIR